MNVSKPQGIENPRVGSSILSLGTGRSANSAESAAEANSSASTAIGEIHRFLYTGGTVFRRVDE